jgi:hypothetical protein
MVCLVHDYVSAFAALISTSSYLFLNGLAITHSMKIKNINKAMSYVQGDPSY